MSCFRTLRRDRRGASAVEFAMVSVPLMATLLCAIEFGRFTATASEIGAAARETVRIAMISSAASDQPVTAVSLETFLKDRLVLADEDIIDVSITWNPSNEVGAIVTIQATYEFEMIAPFLDDNLRFITIDRTFSRPVVN